MDRREHRRTFTTYTRSQLKRKPYLRQTHKDKHPMAQAVFSSILDKAPADVKPPETLPVGSYLCTVQGLPRHDKSTKKGTPFIEYTLIIQQPMDDVDEDALNAFGDVKGKPIKATFYDTEQAGYRIKEFFEHCGLDTESVDTLRELVDSPNGCQVIAHLKHEASDDGKRTFARLAGTAPVES